MTDNNGNYKRNNRNDRSESYGIFDENTVKQKISIPGFERKEEEEERKPQRTFDRGDRFPSRQEGDRFPSRQEGDRFPSRQEGDRFPNRQDNRTTPRSFEQRRPANAAPHAQPSLQSTPRPAPTNPAKAPLQTPRNFFAFDVETVPCIETARTFLNLPENMPEAEVIEKLTAYHSEITNGQNEFFRQLFHKIVCVSFVAGIIQPLKGGKEKYTIKSIKTGGRNGESEEEILRAIFSYLNKHPSRLISFNGRGFDLPVLQYRAMKYGIDAKWIYNDGYYNYNHRYSIEKHCDLLDMFSNFGASARVKMAEVAALFKVPCKINGIDGSNVHEMFKAGKIEEICNYCENDVIATYILYLRFMEHSGKLSAEGYNIVIDNLVALLKADAAPAHHTLFAEKFLALNLGEIHIKVPVQAVAEKTEENLETSEAENSIDEELEVSNSANEEVEISPEEEVEISAEAESEASTNEELNQSSETEAR
jgi:predicted PolB exonuclease-like 3'-5' exonuclease